MSDIDSRAAFQLARGIRHELESRGLLDRSRPTLHVDLFDDILALYDLTITDPRLRSASRSLFRDGYYALAVEEAYKVVNNSVKARCTGSRDGADLMTFAFSPTNPRLKVNELQTDSQRDQQKGYMQILAGCMTGIRNPRAHEHEYLDEPHVGLELLVLANHLLRIIDGSQAATVPFEA